LISITGRDPTQRNTGRNGKGFSNRRAGMMVPSKQEIKNWRNDHVTSYVLGRLTTYRKELLEEALHKSPELRGGALDRVLGVDMATAFMDELHKEGE